MSKRKATKPNSAPDQSQTGWVSPAVQLESPTPFEASMADTTQFAAAIGIDYSNLTEDLNALKEKTDAELERQAKQEKGESIYTFQEGDIIINILPKKKITWESSGFYGFGGSTRREEPDYSYRRPLRLMSIKNNIIYLRRIQKGGSGPIVGLPADEMENGWKIFEIPVNLTMDDVCNALIN